MGIKQEKLNSAVKVFDQEFLLLEEMELFKKCMALEKSELSDKFILLIKQYKKLLKQSVKITRIGDSNVKKLLRAKGRIEEQKIALETSRKILSDELQSAAEYIMSRLPAPLEKGPLLTQWRFVPSKQLGGDSFGYHWLDNEHFAIYLLDVCSHGVKPALLSVSVVDVLRSQNLMDTDFTDPGNVLTGLNKLFNMKKHQNLFFSIWYGVFNINTSTLTYATAGHPPALLFKSSAESEPPTELRTRNLVIGSRREIIYKSKSISLKEAFTLYIFSDGAFEVVMPNGSIWSLQALKDFLVDERLKEEQELDRLYALLQEIHGSQDLSDDFSIIKFEYST